MDARQFSLRQLVMMRDGKQDCEYEVLIARRNDDWDQTAALLATISNMLAEKPRTPDQCNQTLNSGDTGDDPAVRAEQDLLIAKRQAEYAEMQARKKEQEQGGE